MIAAARLDAALAATWPAAATRGCGPFTLRTGPGGKRVRAATLEADGVDPVALDAAIAAMRAAGRVPLFRVRAPQSGLDTALADRGFARRDETVLYAAPAAPLAARTVPPVTAFDIWPPLAVQRRLWAEGGIGADRIAVMERACAPKTALLGRLDDRPAGTGFAAVADGIAMVHALEVSAALRRRGLAAHMMAHAARWADRHGAEWVAVAVTRANGAARGLYTHLGMSEVGRYWYRMADPAAPCTDGVGQ